MSDSKEVPSNVDGASGPSRCYAGSRFVEVGSVTIGCMSEESRDLLDTIMDEYRKHYNQETHTSSPDQVYQFAYWLCRWSGLVRPA